MATLLNANPAPNGPGNPLNWSRADKDAVGTARSLSSQVWYTAAGGIITEVYFPDVDTPQMRDFQLIITDGSTVFHDATKDFTHQCTLPYPEAQAIRLTSKANGQPSYTVVQEIIAEPGSSCLLVRTTLQGEQTFLDRLRVYALLAPHIGGYGAGNSGFVARTAQGDRLVATRGNYWLALGADCDFGLTSCGFVGRNDGWTDIVGNKRLPVWEYDSAIDGYVALTAEIKRAGQNQFVLALAFCIDEATPITRSSPNAALAAVSEALSYPFDAPAGTYSHLQEFIRGWKEAVPIPFVPNAGTTGDGDRLFNMSRNVLLSHEDKTTDGALVASLSIPWGQTVTDLACGYHMVWPRDMCQSATALLAAGETDAPLRGLIFLAESQAADGSFHQKFFIDGEPWPGDCVQLDEYSFPIILAYRLSQAGCLQQFDPKGMVLAAAGALIRNGPMTQQERWEELEGYSPSTLASNIAALMCAADLTENKWADLATAKFLGEYADFLQSHLETWCVTTQGTLVPGISKHFIRILPTHVKGGSRDCTFPEDPNTAQVTPWGQTYNVRDIVDAGFLELVRYGICTADDPTIENSVKVVDAKIRKELPGGPGFYRYNHDRYGQGDQGQDWSNDCSFGVGRPWPLLTGERGHYELAAGDNATAKLYVRYLEAFAGSRGLLPEQLWDLSDLPNSPLVKGGPTGSAMPLAWAHAEYIKLVRSVSDNRVFDRLDIVANRYHPLPGQPAYVPSVLEVWNFDRQFLSMTAGKTVRIPLAAPFLLRWTRDGGHTWQDTTATDEVKAIGIYYVDLLTQAAEAGSALTFTFFWLSSQTWQGANFSISLYP